MAIERTLVLVKPDGVERRLVGRVLSRYEDANLEIIAIKKVCMTRELASKFYSALAQETFFQALLDMITSGPVIAITLEGENAISRVRRLHGTTDHAYPGTIRGDLATSKANNVVHGSDSERNAEREIKLLFRPRELSPPL